MVSFDFIPAEFLKGMSPAIHSEIYRRDAAFRGRRSRTTLGDYSSLERRGKIC